DGSRLLAGSSTTADLWDLEAGKELREFPISAFEPSQEAKRAAADQGFHGLRGHTSIQRLALASDGRRALFRGSHTLVDHAGPPTPPPSAPAPAPRAGRWEGATDLAVPVPLSRVSARDSTLHVWDVEAGKELQVLGPVSGEVNSVALSADGRRAISINAGKVVTVWQLPK